MRKTFCTGPVETVTDWSKFCIRCVTSIYDLHKACNIKFHWYLHVNSMCRDARNGYKNQCIHTYFHDIYVGHTTWMAPTILTIRSIESFLV